MHQQLVEFLALGHGTPMLANGTPNLDRRLGEAVQRIVGVRFGGIDAAEQLLFQFGRQIGAPGFFGHETGANKPIDITVTTLVHGNEREGRDVACWFVFLKTIVLPP